jgi:spermidine/putrescine transport system substrate-binding protein
MPQQPLHVTLNLYNWSEYMPQETRDGFEEETGISVNHTTYDPMKGCTLSSNYLMTLSQYDLAIPSTYYNEKNGKRRSVAR